MGYMTSFSLEWSSTKPGTKPCAHCSGTGKIDIEDAIQEYVNNEKILYAGTESLLDVLGDSCKWYEHEEDMRRVSKVFPSVLFTLRGEGEESGDIWVKYFKDGKMQVAKAEIKLGPFDPSQLK